MIGTLRSLSSSVVRSLAIALSSLSLASVSAAQAAPAAAPPTPLTVGEMAPDFTVIMVTKDGVSAKPFVLSEHKGETVVLAFFPKARTTGCTVQMESYRDRYSEMFNGGKKITLVGVSTDADTTLLSWAKDANFPFAFAADTDRKVGVAYGANNGMTSHRRTLYVIDPSGKISYVAAPFQQMSADAYTQLGAAVTHAAGAHH
ncbi:MAG: peroxiredoxin family protein [Gemmatimonas sp.]